MCFSTNFVWFSLVKTLIFIDIVPSCDEEENLNGASVKTPLEMEKITAPSHPEAESPV